MEPDFTAEASPRDIFLTRTEVISRYRWGRTAGYVAMRKPGFPGDIAGRYRLDHLLAWEDRCAAPLIATPPPPPVPRPPTTALALPPSRRPRKAIP